MSRLLGGYVGHTPVPATTATNSAAGGMWTLREAQRLKQGGTWPVTGDVHFSSVTCFMSFEGANNSTTFTDSTGNVTWTASGDAKISTANAYAGTSSLLLDGTDDFLNATSNALALGSGNFCLEMWIYANALNNTNGGLFSTHNDTGGTDKFFLYVTSSNKVEVVSYDGTWPGTPSVTLPLQTWTHIAFTRSGSTLRLFQNGQVIGNAVTNSSDISRNVARIGGVYTHLNGNAFNGYIDLFRVTKGVARYESAFTPSDYSYP